VLPDERYVANLFTSEISFFYIVIASDIRLRKFDAFEGSEVKD
jgi:hypothetical protein